MATDERDDEEPVRDVADFASPPPSARRSSPELKRAPAAHGASAEHTEHSTMERTQSAVVMQILQTEEMVVRMRRLHTDMASRAELGIRAYAAMYAAKKVLCLGCAEGWRSHGACRVGALRSSARTLTAGRLTKTTW